ncbi:hypothetical protein [Aeromicrobium choanae]|uniref:YrhK-like protein n=1 Tax=Aeromicrobium choanae TaxID=1736691 RepID=A0A1T4Z9D8_9ACTN|nr:hypothetical protein [Aeromicrobium choanae]SKB10175.1 hypothetical protein SAMN06295964_3162 [Aeromicrobium choanae]
MADVLSARRAVRLNLLSAGSFVCGGSLFAAGAALAQRDPDEPRVAAVTYLVGGFFFSLGGFLSVLLAGRARSRARLSAVVLFVGTLFFAVSLVAAFASGLTPRQSNGWIWFPDIIGCVCFLASGHLALVDVGDGRWVVRPGVLTWWVAAVNQLGSAFFFLAGLAAFIRPATDQVVNAGLVNWGTFAGAVCFVGGAVLQAFDTPTSTRTAGLVT